MCQRPIRNPAWIPVSVLRVNENSQLDFSLAFHWSPGGVGEVAYGAQDKSRQRHCWHFCHEFAANELFLLLFASLKTIIIFLSESGREKIIDCLLLCGFGKRIIFAIFLLFFCYLTNNYYLPIRNRGENISDCLLNRRFGKRISFSHSLLNKQ